MMVRTGFLSLIILLSVICAYAVSIPTPPYCPPSYCSGGVFYSGCAISRTGECNCAFSGRCESGECTRDGTACYVPLTPTPTPTPTSTPTPTPSCRADYCLDGYYFTNCHYSADLGRCACDSRPCDTGRCNAEGTACATPSPTPTPTPVPCNDYCSGRIFYSGGYRDATGACHYAQSASCPYGCSISAPGCAAAPTPTPSPTATPTPTAAPTLTPTPTPTPAFTCPNCTSGCYGFYWKNMSCITYGSNQPQCATMGSYYCAAGCNETTKCNFRLGPAQFKDKDGVMKPLRDARVTVRYAGDPVASKCQPGQVCIIPIGLAFDYEGYTDYNGYIVVPGVNLTNHTAGTLTVTVFLEDVNNTIALHVYPSQEMVPNKTAVMNFSKPNTYALDLTFSQGEERVLAKIYYHAWEASYFSRVALGTPVDYLPPEEFWYKSPGCGSCNACHFGAWCGNEPGDAWIHFCDDPNKYDNVNYDASPTNMEWHEFGHHLMLDRFNCMPLRAGDNHGSWSNPNSTDSWEEGWAEFFSMMNLQYWNYTDQHDYWVGQPGSAINFDTDLKNPEEMAVASTLYRMLNHQSTLFYYVYAYNNTFNGADCIHLSRTQLWDIIGNQHTFSDPFPGTRYISSVWDLYRAFNQSSIPAIHADCDSDGISNLDEIFIAHGFFYDVNKNGKLEPGEIGYTKGYDANWNPVKRYDSPEIPGNYIQVNATNPDGSPAEEFNMTVSWLFDCGEGPGGYNYTITVKRGERIYFYPPTDNCNATANVTVYTNTTAAPLIPIDNQDYWRRYNASNPYVYSFAPQLQPPVTPTPAPTATAAPSPTPECSPGQVWTGSSCEYWEGNRLCPLGLLLAGLAGIGVVALAAAWKKH